MPDEKHPVFFLHGFMGTVLMHYAGVIKHFLGKWPVHGFDMPGHGVNTEDAKKDLYQQCYQTVVEALTPHEKIRLIGTSYLGGSLALKYAYEYPEKVHSLVLSGFMYAIPKETFSAWCDGFLDLVNVSAALRQTYEKHHGKRWRQTVEALRSNKEFAYENFIAPAKDRLRSLKVETLVINGDVKRQEASCAASASTLNPCIQGEIVKGAGHIVAADSAEQFSQIVMKRWGEKRCLL